MPLKLSIIIPVFNEEKTVIQIIGKVKSVSLADIIKEMIIVDDFSTDGTKNILSKLNDSSLKILFHQKNMGKGSAVRTGLKHATGDIILIQDADMEYDPEEYKKLLPPIIKGAASVVYGSRLKAIKKDLKNMYKLHYLGNKGLTLITNMLFFSNLTDMETCYKVFKRGVLDGITLKATRFDLEPEITAKILKKGYNITEVPINFRGRNFDEGKKITWRDGIKAIYYLIKYRFTD
jgi:glycosyltransferase involved in cell wall biosynthesis